MVCELYFSLTSREIKALLWAGGSSSGCRRTTDCYDRDGPGFPPSSYGSGLPAGPWLQRQRGQDSLRSEEGEEMDYTRKHQNVCIKKVILVVTGSSVTNRSVRL